MPMKLRLRRPRPPRFDADPLAPRLTPGQLTALVVGLVAALLLAPVGAQAAASLADVVITDPADPARQAHVDANGNLRVAGSVRVADTPLAVTSADDPGRLAFLRQVILSFRIDSTSATNSFLVPAGKRLVIRYVSADADLPTGQRLIVLGLHTRIILGQLVPHHFVPVFTGTIGTRGHFAVAQDTQLYAAPETSVFIAAARSGTGGEGTITVSVSGYLIDCAVGACS
ncbi:MAG TPA: hypothetical protein VG276_11375 [Actinomycetes bacterium]|nr:hypothetical protein [Actinomycetes bacterium]